MNASPEIVFYHAPQSRALIVQWMLEELGRPYRLHLLNLKKGEHKQPSYLGINPMGKVPALTHGDVVVTEAAAICCYLADAFPDAGLSIPIGDRRRGPCLKWLFFGPSCLETATIDRMFQRAPLPSGSAGYGDFETTLDVVANALAPGPYLMGEQFTAADVVIGSDLRWGMATRALPQRAEFVAYADRLAARPAMQRVYAKDAELVTALSS
jgi:glutathione S-transferase